MVHLWTPLFLTWALSCFQLTLSALLTVRLTEYGPVRGQIKSTEEGWQYYSFTGIPFAKPPVGELRFKEPQKPDKWNDTLDATKEPPVCIQRNYLFSDNPPMEGQEDCLYLNVYIPKNGSARMPVMVFIHGGSLYMGSGAPSQLGPDYFMSKNVVLVTFNYRLGALGFLSTLDDESPGNYGFKDQVAVFKWIRDNVGHFNGSSDSVTVFGQSAGASCVHYHLISPASKGLIHRAISESGTALGIWALPFNEQQLSITKALAKSVGCSSPISTKLMMECLRHISAADIVHAQRKVYIMQDFEVPFGAVIETASGRNPNPFLTKSPSEYMVAGEFANVPWIIGLVGSEGAVASDIVRSTRTREALNKNSALLDIFLSFSLSTNDSASLHNRCVQFYMGNKNYIDVNDSSNIQGFLNLVSDRNMIYPLYQSVYLHRINGHRSIYVYNFDYHGKYTYGELLACTNETVDFNWGVCHCDDLIYLFKTPMVTPRLDSDNDKSMQRDLIEFWTNFAYAGWNRNPNSPTAPSAWFPVNVTSTNKREMVLQLNFLNITGDSATGPKYHMQHGFYVNSIRFWLDSGILENV